MWNKKRKKENERPNVTSDKVAAKMVSVIEHLQQLFSCKMNRLFEKMSQRNAKWITVFFVLVCGSYCLYLVSNVFRSVKQGSSFSVQQVHRLETIERRDEQAKVQAMVDDQTFQKVQAYRLFLDSINNVNKHLYNRIVTERPGLLDSLKLLEDIYYSQQNSDYEK